MRIAAIIFLQTAFFGLTAKAEYCHGGLMGVIGLIGAAGTTINPVELKSLKVENVERRKNPQSGGNDIFVTYLSSEGKQVEANLNSVSAGSSCDLEKVRPGDYWVEGLIRGNRGIITPISPEENEIFQKIKPMLTSDLEGNRRKIASIIATVVAEISKKTCSSNESNALCDEVNGHCANLTSKVVTRVSCLKLNVEVQSLSKGKKAIVGYCEKFKSLDRDWCLEHLRSIPWLKK